MMPMDVFQVGGHCRLQRLELPVLLDASTLVDSNQGSLELGNLAANRVMRQDPAILLLGVGPGGFLVRHKVLGDLVLRVERVNGHDQ